VQHVAVDELASVVVLAGPNGVGKTSVLNALLQLAQSPASYANPQANIWMVVEATNDTERNRWGQNRLDTRNQHDATLLQTTLQTNRRRNKFSSSFLNFDSDRAIQNIQPFQFSWDVGSPFTEEIGWNAGFARLSDRYNDVRHSLFRLVENQRREVADDAFRLRNSGVDNMALDFPDILAPFKEAFRSLLGPKELVEVSVRDQAIFYELNGRKLNVNTLSSGEREVINIVFDFLLRNPSDCVIMFDEPELHLHPELSYRLLQTLSRIGSDNQFIFSTHSPEIISASLENTVVFVKPASSEIENQAIIVHRDDATHHALQTLGQSIGVISLGRKLVLIEGEDASLDKQTYGAILRNRFPDLILVPVGGKDTLRSFDDIRDSVIGKTIWGVDFFLLCDRDAVNLFGPAALAANQTTKIRSLPRYHLENYFLDADVLSKVFAKMEPDDSWLRDPTQINEALRSFAMQTLPYAVSLTANATFRELVGNVTLMAKNIDDCEVDELVRLLILKSDDERARVADSLDGTAIESLVRREFTRLELAIANDDPTWRMDIPGRGILNRFASRARIQVGRLKQLYLSECDMDDTFGEIVSIFQDFSETAEILA
jgi:ABC-type cobalamin/Fe3+-siderophores transport system ATPase subunit